MIMKISLGRLLSIVCKSLRRGAVEVVIESKDGAHILLLAIGILVLARPRTASESLNAPSLETSCVKTGLSVRKIVRRDHQ